MEQKKVEKRLKDILYWWKSVYQVVIPTIILVLYIVYAVLIEKEVVQLKQIQDSSGFEEMLKTLVTFMSIVLSVFGFLIPSFLTERESSSLIKYFIRHADIKIFTVKLKNLVVSGLIAILLSCILITEDLFGEVVLNILIFLWLWFSVYFVCSAYRFIGIMINLIIGEKKQVVRKIAKKIPDDALKELNENIEKI